MSRWLFRGEPGGTPPAPPPTPSPDGPGAPHCPPGAGLGPGLQLGQEGCASTGRAGWELGLAGRAVPGSAGQCRAERPHHRNRGCSGERVTEDEQRPGLSRRHAPRGVRSLQMHLLALLYRQPASRRPGAGPRVQISLRTQEGGTGLPVLPQSRQRPEHCSSAGKITVTANKAAARPGCRGQPQPGCSRDEHGLRRTAPGLSHPRKRAPAPSGHGHPHGLPPASQNRGRGETPPPESP